MWETRCIGFIKELCHLDKEQRQMRISEATEVGGRLEV